MQIQQSEFLGLGDSVGFEARGPVFVSRFPARWDGAVPRTLQLQ